MPYVPKFPHLFKILFRMTDRNAAEGLYFEGTWHHDNGDDESALLAFAHARLLDRNFGGAFYNYAALTEKSKGNCPETIKAWRDYLKAAANDSRQTQATVDKVRAHLEALEKATQSGD